MRPERFYSSLSWLVVVSVISLICNLITITNTTFIIHQSQHVISKVGNYLFIFVFFSFSFLVFRLKWNFESIYSTMKSKLKKLYCWEVLHQKLLSRKGKGKDAYMCHWILVNLYNWVPFSHRMAMFTDVLSPQDICSPTTTTEFKIWSNILKLNVLLVIDPLELMACNKCYITVCGRWDSEILSNKKLDYIAITAFNLNYRTVTDIDQCLLWISEIYY